MNYKIIYSTKRKRTTSLQVSKEGEIVVRAPKNTSQKYIQAFVNKNLKWIHEKLENITPIIRRKYKEGEKFLYLGNEYPLLIRQSKNKNFKVTCEDNYFYLHIKETRDLPASTPDCLSTQVDAGKCADKQAGKKQENNIRGAFEKFYIQEAKKVIEPRVEYYSKILNTKYNNIKIKRVSTRWGSCSSKQNLNFNYKLIMCPFEVLDYVVVHEVCHLLQKNHQKSFWSLVAKLDPDFKKNKAWLKNNGETLDF
jgi:predicted metal-dependent hydrolase